MKPWEERFKNEYYELKERCDKLDNMLKKYRNGTLDFVPNCSYDLLHTQLIYMVNYLHILEKRIEIENIEL